MKFKRKLSITQWQNNLDQLEQKMIHGHYGSVLESLNSLKEKVELTKSVEISRSFSEITLRAEQGIKKTKDKINSLLILVKNSLSTGNDGNSDLKLKNYFSARSELEQFQHKFNKVNLGLAFNQIIGKINQIKEKMDEFWTDLIEEKIETGRILTEQKNFDEAIKLIKDIFKYVWNIYNFILRSEMKIRIKANSDLIYSAMIKKEIETSLELNNLKNFDESIIKLENTLNIAKKIIDFELHKESIEEINQIIYKIRIAKIKKTIIELGLRFPRLQASDIAEECGEDEGLIVSTIKEMIVNDEIYAKYFENSRSVAFDQRRMEGEIEKFTERLDKQFEEWGKKEQSKTGKKAY